MTTARQKVTAVLGLFAGDAAATLTTRATDEPAKVERAVTNDVMDERVKTVEAETRIPPDTACTVEGNCSAAQELAEEILRQMARLHDCSCGECQRWSDQAGCQEGHPVDYDVRTGVKDPTTYDTTRRHLCLHYRMRPIA